MKIAIIDNYDSFTFNLHHYLSEFCEKVDVFRNDMFEVNDLLDFDGIVISPGPGLPHEAGKTMEIIDYYKDKKPILGICLGHQAIGVYFGAKLKNLDRVLHGIQVETSIENQSNYIFNELPEVILTGRYHSWVIEKSTMPSCLLTISSDINQEVQGIKHVDFDIIGLQFHPESVMTEHGKKMLENWVKHLSNLESSGA